MKLKLVVILMGLSVFGQAQKENGKVAEQKPSPEQPTEKIVSFTEHDQDGESINLSNAKKHQVIDINSVLNISINKDLVAAEIANSSNAQLPPELGNKIKSLTKALESRSKSLDNIQKIVDSYDYQRFKTDPVAFNTYITDLQKAAQSLDDILNSDPRIQSKYIFEYGTTEADTYSGVYKAAEAVLNETLKEVEQYAEDNGVYIQFGGWLSQNGVNRSIPIPGFDKIPPLEPYEVDRWQVIPTSEQLDELKKMKDLASENRGKEDKILKAFAQQQLEQLQAVITSDLLSEYQDVLTELERIKTDAGSMVDATLQTVINDVNSLESNFNAFVSEVNKRKQYFADLISGSATFNMSQIIARVEDDAAYIKTTGKALLDQISTTATSIKDTGLTSLDTLETLIGSLKNIFETGYANVKNILVEKLESLLYGAPVDYAALQFSEEVFKLSLPNLPSQSDLDLINTGIRKEGDRLILKFAIQNKDGVLHEENRSFYMYKVLIHLEGTVGVIFADPLTESNVQTQFQLAPYYNILAKGWLDKGARRRSLAYNRLLDWGIGLHVSAPDFDGDDVPELGVGLVISFFSDYVQTGIAYNVFTADPYWFFGIRMPVPSFNIGSVQSQPLN